VATATKAPPARRAGVDPPAARAFHGLVITPGLLLIAGLVALSPPVDAGEVLGWLFWTVLIALVELLPVPAWRTLQVSMAFPLATAVAILYQPGIAGLILLLGSSDPREFRREVPLLRAVFNRTQVALATAAASAAFHALGGDLESWGPLLAAAPAAVIADYLVNTALVSVSVSRIHRVPVRDVLGEMRIGAPHEYLVSYISLGFLGILLARLFDSSVGWWAVAAFALPLLLARQAFFRTRALERATGELREQQVLLRNLSNRLAEERHEERLEIAGYLHDDLAQVLYRMRLQVDMAEQLLARGNLEAVGEELSDIEGSRDRAMDLVRALVRDLRRSPIGREGLAKAIASFADEVAREYDVDIMPRAEQVSMSPVTQLLCFQVAREAITNAAKHAEAARIRVSLERDGSGAILTVADDGRGFDAAAEEPEGHFGLLLMRERVTAAGGTLRIHSDPGRGTSITARFPNAAADVASVRDVPEAAGEARAGAVSSRRSGT
jgi:signal transduction histidine kinase